MTAKAHRRHKIERAKEMAFLILLLLISGAVWGVIGWGCWTIIKAPP